MPPRIRILLAIFAVLALANAARLTWSHWGLVTIDADDRPLSEILASIADQAGVTLRSDLDPATKVRMHVTRVPAAEALETLSAVTDSRWRLAYVFGQDRAAVQRVLEGFEKGQPPEGWKLAFVPLLDVPGAELPETPPDPRTDVWNVTEPVGATLREYLEQAARNVSAAFVYPTAWNPQIDGTPAPGEITHVASRLSRLAGGRYAEVFLLERASRGSLPETALAASQIPDTDRRAAANRKALEQRVRAEIAKLPAARQAAATKEVEERKALFASLEGLPPEERRSRLVDYFSRPDVQERLEERETQRDSRRTPEQRVERYKKYLDHRTTMQSGPAPAR